MLRYNTQKTPVAMPEYGRNIQQMVTMCMTIADRGERNRCAAAIVDAMGNLYPQMRNDPSAPHKFWNHLAMMSDFKLDVDYPVEIIRPDTLSSRPESMRLPGNHIRFRHYGKGVEQMIARAMTMTEGPERDYLVMLIANQMKKLQLAVNPEGMDDAKIFKDLAEMSHGAIRLSTETHTLNEYQQLAPQPLSKKKKKQRARMMLL